MPLGRDSRQSRNSGKVVHRHSIPASMAAGGMSSALWRLRTTKGSRVLTIPYWTTTAGEGLLRSSRPARGPGEPEARRAHRAEQDGDQEGDPIAPGEVVDGAAEPGPEGAAETVADAEDAVDDA